MGKQPHSVTRKLLFEGRMLESKEKRKGFPASVSGVSVLGGRNHVDDGSERGCIGVRSSKATAVAGGTPVRGQMGLRWWAEPALSRALRVMLRNVHFILND